MSELASARVVTYLSTYLLSLPTTIFNRVFYVRLFFYIRFTFFSNKNFSGYMDQPQTYMY